MRDIRFRGKRLDNGEWVYGYYIHDPKENVHMMWTSESIHAVDPETVGQYTGLKDKNGREIYEGEIIRSVALSNDHHQRGATSVLSVKCFMGNPCLCFYGYDSGVPIFPFCVDHKLEVIGNIHDNPELLEDMP